MLPLRKSWGWWLSNGRLALPFVLDSLLLVFIFPRTMLSAHDKQLYLDKEANDNERYHFV
jgi:hypothetical protein